MSRISALAAALAGLIVAAPGALAAEKDETRAPIFQELVNCRTVADPSERLACYDQRVASLDEAEKSKQLVIADKAKIEEVRKGLFGFSFPNLNEIFAGGEKGGARKEPEEITSTLTSANHLGYGKWSFVLADGAVWSTTEPMTGRSPKAGAAITIRRGILGSFTLLIDGARPVKGKRVG